MRLTDRLRRLKLVWPTARCQACRERPAIACVREGEPIPVFETGVCPACGYERETVPVISGIRCELI